MIQSNTFWVIINEDLFWAGRVPGKMQPTAVNLLIFQKDYKPRERFNSFIKKSTKLYQVLPFFVFSTLCCFSETFVEFILSWKGQQQGKASMHRMPVIHMKKCVAVSKNSKMVKNVKNSKVSTMAKSALFRVAKCQIFYTEYIFRAKFYPLEKVRKWRQI